MLDKDKLANHILANDGKCNMHGSNCEICTCPIHDVCLRIDKAEWAITQLYGGVPSAGPGKCRSIW